MMISQKLHYNLKLRQIRKDINGFQLNRKLKNTKVILYSNISLMVPERHTKLMI